MKNKKNFTKPLKKKEQAAAASKKGAEKKAGQTKSSGSLATNKVFGKPAVDKQRRRDKRNQVGKLLPMTPAPVKQAPKNGNSGKRKGAEAAESASEDEEEYTTQDMLDMIDSDDDGQGYAAAPLLAQQPKKRKRAIDEDDVDVDRSAQHFEKQYAAITNTEAQGKKRMVSLLPIKTKGGEIQTREHEVSDEEEEDDECPEPEDGDLDAEGEEEAEDADSDDDVIKDDAVSWHSVRSVSKY